MYVHTRSIHQCILLHLVIANLSKIPSKEDFRMYNIIISI